LVIAILLSTSKETFTSLVSAALEDKQIDPRLEGYIVEVLCSSIHATYADPRSLRLDDMLRQGLNSSGNIRHEYLRVTGDLALLVSGIFPDSFHARKRKTAYTLGDYIDIGRVAYDSIDLGVFKELAEIFPQIVDSLNDISIDLRLTSRDINKYRERRRFIDARTTTR